jgi:hypothetical protein
MIRKAIFRVKHNRWKAPLISARENIEVRVGDSVYTTIHVYATIQEIQLSLRGNGSKVLGTALCWANRWNPPQDEFSLTQVVKEVIEGYKSNKPPVWLPRLYPQKVELSYE